MRALTQSNVDDVARRLQQTPTLAWTYIDSCTPLHHFANAPGHRPNPVRMVSVLVTAGADVNAPVLDSWHSEMALHWAASNDDVALIDALLDVGADIEHPGSSIDLGPPIQSALGYAQWAAVRRLWERGSSIGLSHAAVLGEMELVARLATATPPPERDAISAAFWNASRAGQLAAARYLLAQGADLNWPAPWDGTTPLDAASAQQHAGMVAWLRAAGARAGERAGGPS